MTSVVIIPARYDSTRFPGKPLYLLKGMPLIQHVYENSKLSRLADDVIVATDSEDIFEKVHLFGGKAVMTDKKHPSGTDRVAEVAGSVNYDIIVNVQADEPLIRPQMIDDVITILDDERASIGTLVKKIGDPLEITDPNIVKVVFDKEGFAIYFSRAPIPYHRDEWEIRNSKFKIRNFNCYKHIGIYSYRREILLSFAGMQPAELEQIEKLEQLRALENGLKIKTKETYFEIYGVDTPEDLEKVKKCLSTSL
ncbi:MAG: 3-deoxy-manno-octulosonate cytidylyltransferase [Nitrospirae bacterium]|jgi:3-deoxy-manno-octulosonate cytidylyltransferase (CMP-KDO synthetase)|nr:3-deoxy-manno-octulosonate cytidylyltransferase [Nitrospirota bacterium]